MAILIEYGHSCCYSATFRHIQDSKMGTVTGSMFRYSRFVAEDEMACGSAEAGKSGVKRLPPMTGIALGAGTGAAIGAALAADPIERQRGQQ